ncbi:uncharacterized protein ISCGN_028897 [Ixodes scapularis]
MVRIAASWLLVALGSAAGQFRDDASCSDHVIDSCGTDFLVFSKASQLPDTPEKLAASCTEELKSLSCAKDYASRCLLGFTRGAALVAINAVQEEVEGKCDSTHILHRRYFEHVGCMNKAGPGIHACVRRFQEALFIAASKAPRKVKVPHACCEELKSLSCAKDYASRCLLGFTRGAALVAINAVQEEVEGKCDSTHILHRRYFEHVGCMNKAGPGIHACVRRFQEALFIAASKAPRKVKVPHACCEYSEFYECTERSLRDNCGDPKTIEHVQDTVSNVVGDLLSIVCGRYQRGSADCLALGKLPPLPANQTVPRNLISPLKAIVRSLG